MSEEIQTALRGINLANDDRILVTCRSNWPGQGDEADTPLLIEDVPEWIVPGAKVLLTSDGRVVDLVLASGKPVKWWVVVGYCRAMGRNHIELHYDGEGASAPAALLDKASYVAIRKASAGPWMLVSTPEMREQRKTNDAVAAAVAEALKKREAEKREQEKQDGI